MTTATITPFLWYVDNAAPAIERYLTVFDDAELVIGPTGRTVRCSSPPSGCRARP